MNTFDPCLDDVKEEDRIMVLDVLRVVRHLDVCAAYEVKPAPRGYEVTCWIDATEEVDVGHDDLGLINQLNDTRIKVMGIRIQPEAKKACIRVRVISLTEPAMVTDAIVLRVKKRSRWWGGDG